MSAACITELASISHRLWCEEMVRDGWKPGPYNAGDRTHDALVPFDELERRDRRRLESALVAEGVADSLLRLCEHHRGPDRDFTTDEMRVGLPVAWAEWVVRGDPAGSPADARGGIESWETEQETGDLSLIRVRWESGLVTECHPFERLLRRIE